jgi:hypothetical protein
MHFHVSIPAMRHPIRRRLKPVRNQIPPSNNQVGIKIIDSLRRKIHRQWRFPFHPGVHVGVKSQPNRPIIRSSRGPNGLPRTAPGKQGKPGKKLTKKIPASYCVSHYLKSTEDDDFLILMILSKRRAANVAEVFFLSFSVERAENENYQKLRLYIF